MGRNGDKGPYAPWNVKCITISQNTMDGIRDKNRGNAKLTEDQVRAIYLDMQKRPHGASRRLAVKFGVSQGIIRSIKKQETWSHVTKLL